VNPRERWQALQVYLSTARTLLEAGDADRALVEADAALAVDPAFLAAQSLRERILASGATPAVRRAPWVSAPPVPPDAAERAAEDRAREQRSEIRRRQIASSPPAAMRDEPQPLPVPLRAEALPRAEPLLDVPPPPTVPRRSETQPPPDPLPDAAQPQAVAPADEPHALTDLPLRPEALPPPVAPDTSYGKFEQRAKRRRVDRRLEAARAALDDRRLRDADAALEEVLDLDPNAPELVALTTALDNLRRAQTTPRHGAWLIAALVCGTTLLGATWLENEHAPLSHSMTAASSPTTVPQPDVAPRPANSNRAPLKSDALPDLVITDNVEPAHEPVAESAGTSGRVDLAPLTAAAPKTEPGAPAPVSPAISNAGSNAVTLPPNPVAPASKAVAPVSSAVEPASNSVEAASNSVSPASNSAPPAATMPAPASMSALPLRSTPPPPEAPGAPSPDASPNVASSSPSVAASTTSAPPPPVSAASAATPPASTAPASTPTVDDAALVREALRRYRAAYNGLDAGSAQSVWPAVDEGALARAFDGLESQTLTFDDCRVQVRSDAATATCRGSARYVPKVGSREPRTEARVWTFSLRKNGSAWQINDARVGR
jgi:hypothetical protein